MDNTKSIDPLRVIGTKYFRDGLFQKEKEVMSYGKQLAIGRKRSGAIYYLDLREACRGIIIGKTRSGKTWLLREIADRLRLIDYDILFLPDVKNEFISSKKPVQEKFRQFLLPGEEPQAMKIVTLRPSFFRPLDNGNCPQGNHYYSINMGAMSRADFMTLMSSDNLTAPQQIIMEIIFERLVKELADGAEPSFDMIDSIVDGMQEINSVQKTAMKFKFRPLKTSDFYIKEYDRNIIGLMRNGYVPAINMEGFDNFGKGSFLYPEVVVGMILRTVIMARRKKIIKEIFIMVDEASRFIPVDKNPSCKRDFMESVDLDTRYGVNYFFATQEIEKIPEQIVKQCRYIFIPYSADVGTIRNCLMMSGLVRNMQTSTNDAIYLKNKLKKHEWVILDLVSSTKEIIKPLAPLSWHLETGE